MIAVGVAGAVLMLVGAALIRILAIRPFQPVDEPANVDYAMQLTHGHIPVAGIRFHPEFPRQRAAFQHTSNHPPLYHAIVGPVLRLGLGLHHPNVGVIAARLMTLVAAVAAVVLIAVLAWSLVGPVRGGRSAQLVVAAAGLLACLPTFVSVSALVQNDTLATALVIAALIPMVRIVRHGLTRSRVAWLAGLTSAAALTRVTSLPACVIAAATIGVAVWIWPATATPTRARRLLRAATPAVVVLVTIGLTAGWFLVLNKHRYGDWTGGAAVNAIVHARNEPASGSTIGYLLHPRSWLIQFTQLTGGLDTDNSPQPARAVPLAVLLIGLLLLGAVAVAIRVGRRSVRLDRRQLLCVIALAVMAALAMGEIAVHAADGGGVHGRYLLPAAAALCIGATALLSLPRRLNVAVVGLVLVIELYGALRSYGFRSLMHRTYRVSGWFDGTRAGFDANGVPAPGLVLNTLLAIVALGLAAHVVALWQLGAPRPDPFPSPHTAALFGAGGPESPTPPEEAAALSG